MTFFSRIANLRCPKCDGLQSMAAIGITLRAPLHYRLHKSISCHACRENLCLRARIPFGFRILINLALGVTSLLLLLSPLYILPMAGLPLWAAILSFGIFYIGLAFAGGALGSWLYRYYFRVEVYQPE